MGSGTRTPSDDQRVVTVTIAQLKAFEAAVHRRETARLQRARASDALESVMRGAIDARREINRSVLAQILRRSGEDLPPRRAGQHPRSCVCGGEGWLWGFELREPEPYSTDTRYDCDRHDEEWEEGDDAPRGLEPCPICSTEQRRLAPDRLAVHFATREATRPCIASWPANGRAA